MKSPNYKKQLIKYVILLTLLILCCNKPDFYANPHVKSGFLDLTNAEIECGPFALDGDWEFYPSRFIVPSASFNGTAAAKDYIKVPSIWNGQKVNGSELSGYGYGSYRAVIKLKSFDQHFAVKLMTFSSAYRLYANGLLVASSGQAGVTPEETTARHLPQTALINIGEETPVKTIELICHVSNFTHPKGGFWYSAYFGTEKQIRSLREKAIEKEMFFIGVFIIMGIFHFVLFIMRPQNRYTLIFSILCFATALRTSLVGENLFVTLLPEMSWEIKVKLEMFTFYILPPIFSFFFYRFYHGYYSRKMNILLSSPAAVFIPVLVFTPYNFSYGLMNINNGIILIGICYMVMIMFITFRQYMLENSIFITGFLILIITVIRDILAINQFIYAAPVYQIGLFFFLLCQSIMISLQSSRAFKQAEVLSRDLELKVEERTRELNAERETLKSRNNIIEKDLEMARSIQMKLIPQNSDTSKVHFYYKPMDRIGGDFFDFINFRDSEKTGIFISDVSGHGVPAALLTSMVKTALLKAGKLREDPAGLLSYINDILLLHSDGYFMTAFYVIIDQAAGEIIYSCAGHNPPYLIFNDHAEELKINSKMIPLGILSSTDLALKYKKLFLNEKKTLNGCNKILLFTDGLTEARSINSLPAISLKHNDSFQQKDFENTGFIDTIQYGLNLQPRLFLDLIIKRVIDFRGNDSFDDDICIICADTTSF